MSATETLQKRNHTNNVLEQKYINRVLSNAMQELTTEQSRILTRASATGRLLELNKTRTFTISNTTATVANSVTERFIDMRRIKGRAQKRIRIHNAPIYTKYNTIVGRLRYGLTDAVRSQLSQELNIELHG